MQNLVGRNEICALLLMNDEQLQYYIKRGMPHEGTGTKMKFNLHDCNSWFAGKYDSNRKENKSETL